MDAGAVPPPPPGMAAFLLGVAGLPGGRPNAMPAADFLAHLAGAIGDEFALQGLAAAQARAGGLPADLLLSDRDFTEGDYEALLALDAGIAQRGLSPSEIAALPTVTLPRAAAGRSVGPCTAPDGETRCPICLEDYRPGATLIGAPCVHFACRACATECYSRRATCPVCVSKVAP